MGIRVAITFLLVCAPIRLFAQPAHLVKDIFNLPAAASSNPQKFAQVGATIYFVASDASNGTELWKTDGTAAGTMLVRDIQLGPNSSAPDCLQRSGAILEQIEGNRPSRTHAEVSDSWM